MVGGDAEDRIGHALCRLIHSAHALIDRFDGLHGSVENACVSDHIAVCEVAHDHLVLIALYCLDALFRNGGSTHLGDEVVCRELLRRRDKASLLTLAGLFDAAVEEERDVRVLLGLGNAELLEALCRDNLADRALELLGRIGYRQGQRLVILRGADKAQRIHAFFAHKAVKLRQSERPCHLSGAVRAEVHEYHAVALVHDALGAHDDGLNKLVGYVCLVAVFDRLHWVGVYCALAADDGVVACLDSVPALVAIHAVESALNSCDLRVAEGDALVV